MGIGKCQLAHTINNGTAENTRRNIREFQDADEDEVVRVWHRSGSAAYTYLPTWKEFTLEKAQFVFHNIIREKCAIWVGTQDEQIVAYLAMNGSYIDRLYVDPREWGKGWGSRFVLLAKQISPGGLELHTHQANHAARSFYERHGFKAIKFGISPSPESMPDIEYHWRP